MGHGNIEFPKKYGEGTRKKSTAGKSSGVAAHRTLDDSNNQIVKRSTVEHKKTARVGKGLLHLYEGRGKD